MVRNQKGMVLIFVVVIIGIVGILYTSIYVLISTERKIHQSLEDRTKAYYVAESGLERALALLKQGNETSFSVNDPFASEYKARHQFDVSVSETQPGKFRITSVGTYNRAKRIIEAIVLRTEETFLIQSRKEID